MSGDTDIGQLLDCLSELLDAAIHGENAKEKLRKLEELDEELERATERLRLLQDRIKEAAEEYVEASDDPDSKGFAETIAKFVSAAAKQEETRLQKKFEEEKRAAEAAANSESELARAAVEVFLSRCPIRAEEKRFSLRLVEDSYVLTCKHSCAGEIEYEFMLDTKTSPTLNRPLTPTALGFKPKIPVAIGKSWIKQSAPQMVKLDRYTLREADATPKSLIYVLEDPESGAQVRIVYTKNEKTATVSVTYRDESVQTDISSSPALSKYLDTDELRRLSETLLATILQLEPNKLRLTELSVGGEDILAKQAYAEFLAKVLEQIPAGPQGLYAAAAQAGLEEKAKSLLEKARGLGDMAQPIYTKLGVAQNQN